MTFQEFDKKVIEIMDKKDGVIKRLRLGKITQAKSHKELEELNKELELLKNIIQEER